MATPAEPQMPWWRHGIAAISLTVIAANLIFWSVPLFGCALAKLLAPPIRPTLTRWMDRIYRGAVLVNTWWLRGVLGIAWPRPRPRLGRDATAIVLSNHVNWADVLILQDIVVPDGPLLKFLAKFELVFVPVFGLICWAYGFPLLRRTSAAHQDDSMRRERDLARLKAACKNLLHDGGALTNFAEGTRFSGQKRDAAGHAYAAVLRPRSGGFANAIEVLADHLVAIVDVTLIYPEGASFWRLLAGAVPNIDVRVTCFGVQEMPTGAAASSHWLNARWQAKDRAILEHRSARSALR